MAGPPRAVAVLRHAVRSGLLESTRPVLVACSGGADSVALAAALAFEGRAFGVRIGGVTVDHGLQAGSAERAEGTAELLRGLDLTPVLVRTAEVGAEGGPEGAARAARYAALADAARECDARVALAHTLDDQAETVLLGLGRGSGPRSVAGMVEERETDGVTWWRPLLAVRRSTARQACADQDLPVWEDPWNADPAYTRARLRSEVLPLLEDVLGGGVAPALARTAAMLREDLDALDALAATAPRPSRLPAADVAHLPPALRRRVLRLWLRDHGVPDLQAVHLDAVDALVARWKGQGRVDLPGGAGVVRASGRLVLQPPDGRGGAPRNPADEIEEPSP
ncbi:tRNA lysidine(34) synthetase TilS [Blastococcus sp. PRF04-17]|uniref:tRNA lysidine(34) synthetase TilS n=1 Tax=Blastococcus sp. PRF04-17 TaxID=2933797 RepID=UPI001FF56FA6|nr:tRNA lysidine(34) synthetase TilS [Blastococcus sp. PRF04-17]UOX99928.1 tRNA lysidine(34) synthetase TilS [Blastococcus sp. PRF04-17]